MKRYFETVRSLLRIANGKFFVIVQMFLSCFLYNMVDLLPPVATAGIISVLTNNNFNGIWYYVVLYVLFYILYFSLLRWNRYTYTTLANYYQMEVQKKLFEHVVNNDSIFQKISKGKIVDTASDDVRYLVDVLNDAAEALMRLLQLVVIFTIFAGYNVLVALLAVIVDLLYFVLMNANSKNVARHYEGTRKYEDKMIDTFNQMISNLRQVKTLDIMPNLNKKLDKTRSKWSDEYKGKREELAKRDCSMPYIVYIGKIILYVLLAYLVSIGQMTIDKLVLLISYFELAITCTDNVLGDLLDLSNHGVRVRRIVAVLSYTENSNFNFGSVDNDYINGLVTFDKVCYKVKNKQILNQVSFQAYPNEITAIVGHSGSGKTTIMNLLYRIHHIQSGSILVDDENIYNYTKAVYTKNVSGVFQRPFVFEMSIKDNLSLIDKDHKNQIEVCKRVGIHDLIESLPNGYNTILKEEDHIFTDGEKQLLTIARALLTKAEILLFDEVTSNIDPGMTAKIGEILLDLKQDHTIIIITHKPEMMELADKVVVLDKGRVVAKGENKAVYEKSSLYRDLRNRTFASISRFEQ